MKMTKLSLFHLGWGFVLFTEHHRHIKMFTNVCINKFDWLIAKSELHCNSWTGWFKKEGSITIHHLERCRLDNLTVSFAVTIFDIAWPITITKNSDSCCSDFYVDETYWQIQKTWCFVLESSLSAFTHLKFFPGEGRFLKPFLPPANEVWGKVIFLHLFVILFTGGGHVW